MSWALFRGPALHPLLPIFLRVERQPVVFYKTIVGALTREVMAQRDINARAGDELGRF